MLIEEANAKINVYLDVTSKREDGYHNIVSIMQTVALCDIVSVDFVSSKENSILLDAIGNPNMPTDEKNLAYRAANLFLQETGIIGKVTIHIEKHIPMAAGLAGGSADAAAVLRGLNRLCGFPFSTDKLCALGSTLGADIPFCIRRGSALVTGIGDVQKSVSPMPPSHIVIACQGNGVSTPAAYSALDEKYAHFKMSHPSLNNYEGILNAWKNKDPIEACNYFFNIFEEVVPKQYPCVLFLKKEMMELGAIRSMMSGSGPSVFGIFPSYEAAKKAQEHLLSQGAAAFLTQPKEREAVVVS